LKGAEVRALAWEHEIAERVARYRRRRGDTHPEKDSDANLEFDFSTAPQDDGTADARKDLDLVLGDDRGAETEAPLLDSIPIQRGSAAGLRPEDAAEWALEPSDFRVAAAEPVEIVLDSGPEEEEPQFIAARPARLAAPVSLRFTAGLVDALILLVSAAIFVLIFCKSGGRLTLSRHGSDVTNVLVLGVLAASFVVFYFGLFTTWAFATPGQSAMGLRVRTLEDEPPDARAARRRALGYLLSTVALMLGFIWAIFDEEGLAWHDRVSGTCLARQRN